MNPNTDNIVSFGVTCWPGRSASSSIFQVSPGQFALSIYLDPVSVLITQPPAGHWHRQMADFCRQLARSADELATVLDPGSN